MAARLRANAGWLLGALALLAFYVWIADWNGGVFELGRQHEDPYNWLADAFLDGQLHLLLAPSAELLALPDPYDPAVNAAYKIHDLALYDDRYYLSWGPTPALVLFVPFRALPFFGDVNQAFAAAVFAFAGAAFAVACLRVLARRFVPDAPRWALGAAAVALVLGNAAPFMLRRPEVYEVAIACGLCFAMAALYFAATAVLREDDRGPSARRLALASLCAGLAFGARPTLLALGLPLLAAAWFGAGRTLDRRLLAAALGPLALCGLLVAAYNQARFGAPLEFGQQFQLAGEDQRLKETLQPRYLLPGLFLYFLSRPVLTYDFPYVHLQEELGAPFTLPEGYTGVEQTGGLLWLAPILLALPAVVLLRRHPVAKVVGVVAATGLAVVVLVSLALWGTTQRYEVDFASFLLIGALLVWLAFARKRVVAVLGAVAIAATALMGTAVGMVGYTSAFSNLPSERTRDLEQGLDLLPAAVAKVFGGDEPRIVDVNSGASVIGDGDPGAGVGNPTFTFGTTGITSVEVLAPTPTQLPLAMTVSAGPDARPGPPPRFTVTNRQLNRTVELESADPAAAFLIPVARGLNELDFRVVGSVPADAPQQLVRVDELQIRKDALP